MMRGRGTYVSFLAVGSGLIWISSWMLSQLIIRWDFPNGIDLIFLPAGVRLVILMVAGLWGAFGITVFFPLAYVQVFPGAAPWEMGLLALINGFIPYLTLVAAYRWCGIPHSMTGLRSWHLPVLAASVSTTAAISNVAALALTGRFHPHQMLRDIAALATGDFLGCFLVLLLIWALFNALRLTKRKR